MFREEDPMQLNLSTDYALRSLIMLNGQEQGVSSHDISKHIGIEREFTLKILRQLKQGGFVKASRGKTGGYMLSKPLHEISLFQVLNHMEDSMYINRCLEPDHRCNRADLAQDCHAHRFYVAFQNKLEEVLSNISLQDVINDSYSL